MPTAKKLPSGNWRIQVYTHTDINGKKHKKSFTAETKREVELKAANFIANNTYTADKKIIEAVKGYIKVKEGVLSPSTIRKYNQMVQYYSNIGHIKLSQFDSEKAQQFISDLASRVSPKSTANIWGLLSSSISMYSDRKYRVTLPKIQKAILQSPSDEDVQNLFTSAPLYLKICIALSAYGSIRRGEIAALKYGDLDREANRIFVHADIVKDTDGNWIYKETKTPDGKRYKTLPPEVINLIPENEDPDSFIIKWTPDSITKRFIDLRNAHGVNIRFHDLRHYFASIGAALGIPDLYMADFGGWKQNSKVLKSVYQNKIVPISERYEKELNDHFSSIINSSHKVPTENKKAAD